MVPVANIPMIMYTLKMLQTAQFDGLVHAGCSSSTDCRTEVIVIAQESASKLIHELARETYGIHMSLSITTIPNKRCGIQYPSTGHIVNIFFISEMGTVEALRLVKHKIHVRCLFFLFAIFSRHVCRAM